MSVLDKMVIRGIRSFSPSSDQRVEFYSPLTLIVGTNGAGKTTIIECLKFSTTGDFPPGADRGKAFVHDPKIQNSRVVRGDIQLRFLNSNGLVTEVARSLQVSGKTFKQTDAAIKIHKDDGTKESITRKCIDINKEIPDLLGVSSAILDCVIFCHQEESHWPLMESSELKKRFDAIFATTDYANILVSLKGRKRDLKECLEGVRPERAALAVQLKQFYEWRERHSSLLHQCNDDDAWIEEMESEVDKLRTKIDKVNARGEAQSHLRQQWWNANTAAEMAERDANVLLKQLSVQLDDDLPALQLQMHRLEEQVQEGQRQATLDSRPHLTPETLQAWRMAIQQKKSQIAIGEEHARQRRQAQQQASLYLSEVQTVHAWPFEEEEEKGKGKGKESVAWWLRDDWQGEREAIVSHVQTVTHQQQTAFRQAEAAWQQELTKRQDTLSAASIAMATASGSLQQCQQQLQAIAADCSQWEAQLAAGDPSPTASSLPQLREALEDAVSAQTTWQQEHLQWEQLFREADTAREQWQRALQQWAQLRLEVGAEETDALDDLPIWLTKFTNLLPQWEEEAGEARQKERESAIAMHAAATTLSQCREEVERAGSKFHAIQTQCAEAGGAWRALWAASDPDSTKTKQTKMMMKNKNHQEESTIPDHAHVPEALEVLTAEIETAEQQLREQEALHQVTLQWKASNAEHCPLCHQPAGETVRSTLWAEETPATPGSQMRAQVDQKRKRQMQLRDALPHWYQHVSLLTQQQQQQEQLTAAQAAATSADLQATLTQGQWTEAHQVCVKAEAQLNGGKHHLQQLQALQMEVPSGGDPTQRYEALLSQRSELQQQGTAWQAAVGSCKDQVQKAEREEGQRLHLSQLLLRGQSHLGECRQAVESAEESVRETAARKQAAEEALEAWQANSQDKRAQLKERVAVAEEVQKKVREVLELPGDSQREMEGLRDAVLDLERKVTQGEQHLQQQQSHREQQLAEVHRLTTLQQVVKDNMQWRQKSQEAESLRRQANQLHGELDEGNESDDVSAEDLNGLKESLRELEASIHVRAGLRQGRSTELERLAAQVQGQERAGLEQAARKQHLAAATLDMAMHDVDDYMSALDKALILFHAQKMAEINLILRDLWMSTYRGHDIDCIQICSDEKTDKRGSYHYRVVMIRGDSQLDMRGRCSAGQKVLACILIRLALAEAFCGQCGILALDEPTTNLDYANIIALAAALNQLLQSRAHQKSFQLLIITHDEDFVRMLHPNQLADYFYRVTKDDDGCSVIDKIGIEHLS